MLGKQAIKQGVRVLCLSMKQSKPLMKFFCDPPMTVSKPGLFYVPKQYLSNQKIEADKGKLHLSHELQPLSEEEQQEIEDLLASIKFEDGNNLMVFHQNT